MKIIIMINPNVTGFEGAKIVDAILASEKKAHDFGRLNQTTELTNFILLQGFLEMDLGATAKQRWRYWPVAGRVAA